MGIGSQFAVETKPQGLSGAKQKQLHRAFAPMQAIGDRGESKAAAIMQIESLASRLAERIEAIRQHANGVVVPLIVGRMPGFQLQTQLGPSHFATALQPPHSFAQQVSGDANQPGPHERRAIEPGVGRVAAQKNFLAKVFGIGRFQQPGTQIAIHSPLMPLDECRKGASIAALGRFEQ
jgi:hypothetical protein